ncbi:MAG: response regulator [Candidatus Schekmanbacteria bacterium]|nr:response regulator [Candidatus Schekmanbacteria bacterium]
MCNKCKVLIVDEDFAVRENLKLLLQSHYDVTLVSDGKKAIKKIYKEKIDLVTLDLEVSNPRGIELVKAIKDHDSDIEIVIITANTDLRTAIDALHYGVFDYLNKPFNMTELISVMNAAAQKRQLNIKLKSMFKELNSLRETKLTAPSSSLLGEDEILIKIAHKICYSYFNENQRIDGDYNDYLRFVRLLASTLESKDPYTHGHSERVSYYSALLSGSLSFEAKLDEELRIAAYLHDIGKIGVSDKLVRKQDSLTNEEWSLIKEHPEKGVNLICCLKTSRNIISYVRHHHERFDGKGYPYGLSGEDIPIGGRIIAIADAYDAMISDRPYRRALSPEQAQIELEKCAGTQFDPKLVKLFLETLPKDYNQGLEPIAA